MNKYIEVDPDKYIAFFEKLLAKFIAVEMKGDISDYPGKYSRQIWLHWDHDNNIQRSKYLFQPTDQADFSHEYFWVRYKKALRIEKKIKKLSQPLAFTSENRLIISSEAFALALEYIDVQIPTDKKNKHGGDRARNLYNSFCSDVTNNSPSIEQKENWKLFGQEKIDRRISCPIMIEETNVLFKRFFVPDKNDGTYFIEKELPTIIEKPTNGFIHGIIFFDVDDLTIINKNFSFYVGTQILKEVPQILMRRIVFDYAGRCGDDTFFCIMYNTTEQAFLKACSKIRSGFNFQHWKLIADNLRVTCSIGYALSKENENVYSWMQRAIVGMLNAKEQGKNIIQPGPQFLRKSKTNAHIFDFIKEYNKAASGETSVDEQQEHSETFSLRTWFS